MSGAKTRLAAAQVLMKVLEERRTLDEALSQVERFDALSGPDRGFARAIVSEALRQLGRIDEALEPFLARPLETAPPAARALLRVGATQSWLMDTPDHAVVGETVAAAKLWPIAQRSAGFLNAVLRKVTADRSGFDAVPLEHVWPEWLRTSMREGLGARAALALAQAQTQQPPIYLTPKNGDTDALAKRVEGEVVAGHSVRIEGQAVESLPGYEVGDLWVQDVAAALPARLLGASVGSRVFDLCAAPGGKTMQLATSGAEVVALDRSRARLKRLKANLKRTGFDDIKIVEADATEWAPSQKADHILLDAPCSALGTLARHPEGAWIKREEDVARYPDIQSRLLSAALDMLKPGGHLVYCVCSPLPQEGVQRVEAALSQGGIKRMPVLAGELPGFERSLTSDGDVLTLPGNEFAYDNFFIARLKKRP